MMTITINPFEVRLYCGDYSVKFTVIANVLVRGFYCHDEMVDDFPNHIDCNSLLQFSPNTGRLSPFETVVRDYLLLQDRTNEKELIDKMYRYTHLNQ